MRLGEPMPCIPRPTLNGRLPLPGRPSDRPGLGAFLRSVIEYETDISQQGQFDILERKAAPSFNGNGLVISLAHAEQLLGLPKGHANIMQEETGKGYVVSVHDPDIPGGLRDYARVPYLVNVHDANDDNFAVSYSAQVIIPSAGEYTFAAVTGYGFRLTSCGNSFEGPGTQFFGPVILARDDTMDGTLTAMAGGSGEVFYFPNAGTYDLTFIHWENQGASNSGFGQLFAAQGNRSSFDPGRLQIGRRRVEWRPCSRHHQRRRWLYQCHARCRSRKLSTRFVGCHHWGCLSRATQFRSHSLGNH